jgi:phospholipid/cholesterol/gamma-HCH transport system substrate-binding protein
MNIQGEKFKIRLGLFVIGGFLLFVAAIFVIGRQNYLFDPVIKVSATFYNVSGLQPGNNVRFSGINVGTIDAINVINDSTVQVDMLIEKSMQPHIKIDSKVRIGSDGLIGDRILMITQGSLKSPMVRDGDFLLSYEPIETDDIIESVEISAVHLEVITLELAEILTKINSGEGTLGRLISDSTIAENLSETMENLKSSSKGLDQNMNAVKDNILLRGYFKRKSRDRDKEE